ncbi:hypothetical protein J437_LFUL004905 [Ladona fulva]|uniref:Uncharacterized protein n=1 Tax=Ladona fulva TaxID=123851 RepID=A0A8K0K8I2_LADFU|nr:hypothetical protein J437_LFUL004905 [Ladona fulva]
MARKRWTMTTTLEGHQHTKAFKMVTCVHELLNSDCHKSAHLLNHTLYIPKTIEHHIVMEALNMQKVCTELVPKLLTDKQKAN